MFEKAKMLRDAMKLLKNPEQLDKILNKYENNPQLKDQIKLVRDKLKQNEKIHED